MSISMRAVQVRGSPILSNRENNSLRYQDIRLPSSKAASQQRSINLAISHRGLAALEAIDPFAMQRFMQAIIPMRGRMIHTPTGELDSQLYDKDGQVGASSLGKSFGYLRTHSASIPSTGDY